MSETPRFDDLHRGLLIGLFFVVVMYVMAFGAFCASDAAIRQHMYDMHQKDGSR